MNETQIEKRRHARKQINETAFVFDSNTGEKLGQLLDISREGFMLLSIREITVQQQLNLTLELPNTISVSGHHLIKVSAKCAWCQPSSFSHDFGAGFQITSISEQDNVALQYFIRDF
ncbi:MAG: PilZ domain-containing protein [Endozoicomonadaceae bacterium]|nr:PilZ domain-containing protein [Endozoicomonadaceae bacterium]